MGFEGQVYTNESFIETETKWKEIHGKHNLQWCNVLNKEKDLEIVEDQFCDFAWMELFSETEFPYIGFGNLDAKAIFLFNCPTYYDLKKRGEKGDTHQTIETILSQQEFNIKDIYYAFLFPWTIKKEDPNLREYVDLFIPYLLRRIEIIKPKIVVGIGSAMKYIVNCHFRTKFAGITSEIKKIFDVPVPSITYATHSFLGYHADHPFAFKSSGDDRKLEEFKISMKIIAKACNPNKISGQYFFSNGKKLLDPTKEMKNALIILNKKKKRKTTIERLYERSNFKTIKIESDQKTLQFKSNKAE